MKKSILFLIIISAFLTVFLSSCQNESDSTTQTQQSKTQESADDTSTTITTQTLLQSADKSVNIVFISSGKSDAILIMADGKTFMVDVGEKGKDNFKPIKKVLELYGIKTIDGVFLSHAHSDHIGGMKRLAENYDVKHIYSASLHTVQGGMAELADELKIDHILLGAGEKFAVTDEIFFDVLAPISLNQANENDNSLILMFNAYGKKILFTGDMEFWEEATLLDNDVDVKADILKVANHGNPDASSSLFLNATSPKYAVICTDRSVDYDSANEMVISTLPNTKFYITDEYELGVFFSINQNGEISVETK